MSNYSTHEVLNAIAAAQKALSDRKDEVNRLNVFPVPDGDTGTNMSLTMQMVVDNLAKLPIGASSAEIRKTITTGALMGARGNSGVITSQILRGLCEGFEGFEEEGITTASLDSCFARATEVAFQAVRKPVEGTILTVIKDTAAAAKKARKKKLSTEEALDFIVNGAYESVQRTPEFLPVLKENGVVDAGGKGYLIILEGMLRALQGEPVPEVEETETQDKADFAALGEDDITFTFDTVFIVRKTSDKPLDDFRTFLNSIGDSLVIGEDDEAFKVHVHTDIPGEALTEAQKYGTLELAKIENMRTQAADLAAGRKAQSTDDLDQIEQELESGAAAVAKPEKKYGFLAVCAGDGLAATFRDLGVDRIVSGGQTMNPSTEAILQEVNQTPSEVVFVLPNNKNIIMAAQQCVGLTEKQVIIVPTATVPQGITAMMNVDLDEEDPQVILQAMTEAAQHVTTAQVTYAARNSDFDGFAISEGDYLALTDGKLYGTDRDLGALLESLAKFAGEKDAEFITVFYGADVTEDDAAKAESLFAAACPNAELTLLPGGQPVYFYIISIE